MDTGTKTYQIDKHKQLIPLNGSTVHFSCFFEVKSKDKKPFNITIVEQGEIKPKQYKLVDDGYINGQIESDGQLKSYFLVLKAQQPCECEVRIVLKPKEAQQASNTPQVAVPPNEVQSQPEHASSIPPVQPNIVVNEPQSYFQMKYIIGFSLALIAIYFLYKYRKPIFGKFNISSTKDTLMPSISSTSF
jgi:hypothetical protein